MNRYIIYIVFLLPWLFINHRDAMCVDKKNTQDFSLLNEVAAIIETRYVDSIEETKLAEAAVTGMLQSLDGYSIYLKPEEYSKMLMNIAGSFGGLGIEVMREGSFLRITGVAEGAPAGRAGIKVGDMITHINHRSVTSMHLIEALHMMRRKVGDRVQLKVFRAGQHDVLSFNMHCAYIKINSVKSTIIDDDIVVLRIVFFHQKTKRELLEVIRQKILKSPVPIKAVVLDLRDNPGGLLTEGVKVAGLFLEKGAKILSIKDKNDVELTSFYATEKNDIINGIPMAILVNSSSASAAEIVTGALRDHNRAIVIGEKTMGKGAIQDIIPLQTIPGAAIKITTSLYYLPSGTKIDKVGIAPDIYTENSDDHLSIPSLMRDDNPGKQKTQQPVDSNTSSAKLMYRYAAVKKAHLHDDKTLLTALDILHKPADYHKYFIKSVSNETKDRH